MAEFARVLQLALENNSKGIVDTIEQHSPMWSEIKKRSRMRYNEGGKALYWRIKNAQYALDGAADMESKTFARENHYTTATLPWRIVRMGGVVSELELKIIKGENALINFGEKKMEDMKKDFWDQFNKKVYIDGVANVKDFHGIQSFTTESSTSATTDFHTCNDSYAGLTLDAVFGTESAATYYSPILVDEESTTLGSWASNPGLVCRRLIRACTRGNSRDGRPDMLTTTGTRYDAFKDALASNDRVIYGPMAPNLPKTTEFGLEKFKFDGVEVMWDYDHPASVTLCWNFDHMEFFTPNDKLLEPYTSFDDKTLSYAFQYAMFGNFAFDPPYFGKAYAE